MEVRNITYLLRRNLGNYEHCEIKLDATLDEGENSWEAITTLKAEAYNALYATDLGKTQVVHDPAFEKTEKWQATGKTKDGGTIVNMANKGEPKATANFDNYNGQEVPPVITKEMKEEKPKRTRTTKPKDTPATTTAAAEDMEDVESPYKATDKGAGEDLLAEDTGRPEGSSGGKKTAPFISYDRAVKEHRSTFAAHLNQAHPRWKVVKTKEELDKISSTLTGKPFMDAEGNILESFKQETASYFQ